MDIKILPILLVLSAFQVHSVSAAGSCDEVFYGSLRAGAAYQFNDTMTNTTGLPVFVNLVSTTFSQDAGYGNPPSFYDAPLVSSSHVWAPGESGLVTESSTYNINARPAIRSTSNIVIWYDVTYSRLQNGEWGAGEVHRECKFYEITACGDGIVDSGDGESCDDGVQNGQPGKCNNSCQSVSAPSPLCGSAGTVSPYPPRSANPLVSDTGNLCSVGTPANGQTVRGGVVVGANGWDSSTTATWTCTSGTTSLTCGAVGNDPDPQCNPAISGPISAPISSGTPNLCSIGVVDSFGQNTVGNTTNFTWNCIRPGAVISPQPNISCSASYTTAVIPPPVCSSTIQGNLSSPISNGACDSGNVSGFSAIGTNPINYSWACSNGTTSINCAAQYGATAPACTPGPTTGTQTTPVTSTTPGLCPAGQTVGDFTATPVGTTTSYAWSCNGSAVGGACIANYTPGVTPPDTPYISIKKFANNSDGQIINDSLPLNPGDTFNYRYVITNTGTVAATGVVMTDTFPRYISIGTPVAPAGWTCTTGSKTLTGITYATLICTTPTLSPGASVTLSVSATLSSVTPLGSQIRNIAYVCRANEIPTPTCSPICTDPTNPSCTPPPPPPNCSPIPSDPHYDPACVNVSSNVFDLGVKKYVGTNDAQDSASAVQVQLGSTITYQIVVTNFGTGTNTGTTTLRDNLPTGVNFAGTGTWSNGNWNCSYTGTTRSVLCTNSVDRVSSGANLGSTILIPVTVVAGAGQIQNLAHIDNPFESGRCTSTGSIPLDPTSSCTLDLRNSDPAFINITSGGGGGGSDPRIARICSGGVPICANYQNLTECMAAGNTSVNCLGGGNALQLCQATSLSCSGGGGGGSSGGFCGNGVLETYLGEECDVVGAAWCKSCKVQKILTNPGSNDIDYWMNIPLLSRARLGFSWLDGIPGKIPFQENRMVLGLGTKAFTLADTVGFGIKSQYSIPLVISADKEICLKSGGDALNSDTICTTFGDAAMLGTPVTIINAYAKKYGDNIVWTRPIDKMQFVVLGRGEFKYQEAIGGPYYVDSLPSPNNIDLFKGARLYDTFSGNRKTLSSAFFGQKIGTDGILTLATDSVDLVSLPVRISSAVLGTTSTPVNRSIENFISRASINLFLASIRASSTLSSETTTRSDASTTARINFNIGNVGNRSVKNLTELESLAHNGNKNILTLKGNLTIENCIGNTFVMEGVRSIIVEGNLTLKCNTVYGSSDTTSSFAWIVKGGDIFIDPGVTNDPNSGVSKVSGIYVAVGIGGIGGQFRSIADTPSQKILRVEGSLYGFAKPLLDSRLYARGTSAYEILTTGTILTYSNRALVNPPPLLSEYLGNYSVDRVVR